MPSPPQPISTPCIMVCAIDPQSGLCLGCFRALEEVARWGRLSEDERARIMAALPARRDLINPDKLGLQ